MAETTNRSTNITGTKRRKSRNEIIDTTLKMYLNDMNYTNGEISDVKLTQTVEEYDMSMMVDNDTAKVNSILYSNVLCLSTNQKTVEQQFSKFVRYVQGQSSPTLRAELQLLLWPLLCHIYIEMIKGRNSRPATEFLRKFAYLFGPIENITAPVVNELNSNESGGEHAENGKIHDDESDHVYDPPTPSATTQIMFQRHTSDPNSGDEISEYFKELASSLSLCLRIEELESIDITRNFRSAKYDVMMSLQALYAIKHFLIKHGHVIIMHILQTWFSFDIREAMVDTDGEEDSFDDIILSEDADGTDCSEDRGPDCDEYFNRCSDYSDCSKCSNSSGCSNCSGNGMSEEDVEHYGTDTDDKVAASDDRSHSGTTLATHSKANCNEPDINDTIDEAGKEKLSDLKIASDVGEEEVTKEVKNLGNLEHIANKEEMQSVEYGKEAQYVDGLEQTQKCVDTKHSEDLEQMGSIDEIENVEGVKSTVEHTKNVEQIERTKDKLAYLRNAVGTKRLRSDTESDSSEEAEPTETVVLSDSESEIDADDAEAANANSDDNSNGSSSHHSSSSISHRNAGNNNEGNDGDNDEENANNDELEEEEEDEEIDGDDDGEEVEDEELEMEEGDTDEIVHISDDEMDYEAGSESEESDIFPAHTESNSDSESDSYEPDEEPHVIAERFQKKLESDTKIYNNVRGDEILPASSYIKNDVIAVDSPEEGSDSQLEVDPFYRVRNKYLQNVRASVFQCQKLELPSRVLSIVNSSQLSAADVDRSNCHLVCASDDATVRLWQLSHSRIGGRKPYTPVVSRNCEWCLDHCITSSESDYSDYNDDEYEKTLKEKRFKYEQLFARKAEERSYLTLSRRHNRRKNRENYKAKKCDLNTYSDLSGLALKGHSKGVTDVLFSSHNPLLFSVSKDNTMRAWKAVDYNCGAIYRGHNYPIWCVAESSTGLYIATGSRDLTARLWSTDRQYPLQTYIGHTQDVEAVAFHPNGNYIATGSADTTVRLWDVTSGKMMRVFIDCRLAVHCLSFSPDGKYLAAAGDENKVRIFDLASGMQLTELKHHTATINSISWNSSSNKVASCCADGTMRVFTITPFKDSSQSNANNSTEDAASFCSWAPPQLSFEPKLMISDVTGCDRAVKIFFNADDTTTCIGNR